MRIATRLAQGAAVVAAASSIAALRVTTTEAQHWGLPAATPTIVAITAVILLLACVAMLVSPVGATPLPLVGGRYTDGPSVIPALLMPVSGAWRELATIRPEQPLFEVIPDGWPLTVSIVVLLLVRAVRLRGKAAPPATSG